MSVLRSAATEQENRGELIGTDPVVMVLASELNADFPFTRRRDKRPDYTWLPLRSLRLESNQVHLPPCRAHHIQCPGCQMYQRSFYASSPKYTGLSLVTSIPPPPRPHVEGKGPGLHMLDSIFHYDVQPKKYLAGTTSFLHP